jgi:hypothetical protein
MLPPWIAFPRMDAASLGWILGPGDHYRREFRAWFAATPAAERAAFERDHAEPQGWTGFYARMALGAAARTAALAA